MRAAMRANVIAMGAAAMFVSGTALAAPAADGVFFVHGTGDQSAPTSASSAFQASGGSAVSSYWTTSSLGTMATDPDGSGQWSYGVAGYGGASYAAYDSRSWGTIADQLWNYYYYGNNGAIYHVDVVTHSNGSNPIRYMMAHPTAITPGGVTVSTILGIVSKVIFVAGDNQGTPLADKVTSSGSLANLANDLLSTLGITSYNNPAVVQQVQANMTTYNGNGTFATGSTPYGITTNYIYGSAVYAAFWSGDAWCGSYATTLGLKAAALYGWGSFGAATDGFIGTNSSTYVGTDPGYGGDSRLNHNQSRRSCHGSGGRIAAQAHAALSGAFTSIPPDYTIAPAAQACNATTQGWTGTSGTSSYTYWYGCTSAMRTDTNTDFDCYLAYGGDNGYVAPNDYAYTAYSNTSYYADSNNGKTNTGGCSDSWLGDGTCDLCLVAKYGYDSTSGSTADDDCVNKGSGTSNTCFDVAYDGYNSKVGYLKYSVTH